MTVAQDTMIIEVIVIVATITAVRMIDMSTVAAVLMSVYHPRIIETRLAGVVVETDLHSHSGVATVMDTLPLHVEESSVVIFADVEDRSVEAHNGHHQMLTFAANVGVAAIHTPICAKP